MFRAIDISTSGLIAQRQRMNTIAGNIAHANTTRNADGSPGTFQRRFVTFAAAENLDDAKNRGVGVEFHVEIDTTTSPRRVLDPGHRDADADGYVSYPNINPITEFVNAVDASRAYEANVAAIEMTKEMANLALRILA